MKKVPDLKIPNSERGARAVADRIVRYASLDIPRVEFLQILTRLLLDFSGCDRIEIRIKDMRENGYRCEKISSTQDAFNFEFIPCADKENCTVPVADKSTAHVVPDCGFRFLNSRNTEIKNCTRYGSFWFRTVREVRSARIQSAMEIKQSSPGASLSISSMLIVPLRLDGEKKGLLLLASVQANYFTEIDIKHYETLAGTLVAALVNQRAQAALRERVKELTCLYGMARIADQSEIAIEAMMQQIVELLPPAWHYSAIAAGRIVLDQNVFTTANYQEGPDRLRSDIWVSGTVQGFVEVTYLEKKLPLDEGPFLKEERRLIDTVAKQIALIVERQQTSMERQKLQEQLRHADRLATIGQLAAGVAHEINEPLGNILGFAQLACKCEGLPSQAENDLNKIIAASLHAREVIKKLMLFARQMPPKKTRVNLNYVVNEGLYFFESRCEKEGIELVRVLSPKVPEIIADPSQLHQALVNIVVNALQAMPKGGRLTIRTSVRDKQVSMVVEDTGIGMSEEVKSHMFIPFFTTKDVGQGTGIGLSVVHGIVTAHGGTIKVESQVGQGSRFEILLPIIKP